MIAVRDRRDAWVGPSSRPEYGLRARLGWQSKSNSFNESEMALFSECMLKCARKVLDTADIVREAIFQQLKHCPRNNGQFASMCRTTIVRIAPAVTVSTATISIPRFT